MGDQTTKAPRRALYRTHRSRTFDDVVGQTHVTDTLKQSVQAKRTVHAYLFTGPHGVGKTSVARILAHSINELDYDGVTNHLDIIEIDAASNRGIDEVRDLREKALIAPSSAKYKVYIIDEVHMLTTPAFNALLKLLEEPPAHAIFILATTEAHKVPATIRSRAQWYAFTPISTEDIINRLEFIARIEGIKVEPAALALIAAHGRGSLRDAIGLLEQLGGEDDISEDKVANLLGLAPVDVITQLLGAVESKDWRVVRQLLTSAHSRGVNAKVLAQQLIDALNQQPPSYEHLNLVEHLLEVGRSDEPQLKLEIVLLKSALSADTQYVSSAAVKASSKDVAQTSSIPKNTTKSALSESLWQQILSEVKARNNSLYAILRLADPIFQDDTLKLVFGFDFHKQRLSEERNRQLVAEIASLHLGQPVKISSSLNKALISVPPPKIDTLSQVIQVMGGGVSVDYDEDGS